MFILDNNKLSMLYIGLLEEVDNQAKSEVDKINVLLIFIKVQIIFLLVVCRTEAAHKVLQCTPANTYTCNFEIGLHLNNLELDMWLLMLLLDYTNYIKQGIN